METSSLDFCFPVGLPFAWSTGFNHMSLLDWVLVPLRRQKGLFPPRFRKAKHWRVICNIIDVWGAVGRL